MLVYQTLVYIENLCPDTIMVYFELATLNTAETLIPIASLVYRHEMAKAGNRNLSHSSGM